jgi:hypothetical protein
MRANRSFPRSPASIGFVNTKDPSSFALRPTSGANPAAIAGRPAPKTSTMFARYSRRAAVMVRSAIRRCQGEKRQAQASVSKQKGRQLEDELGDAMLLRRDAASPLHILTAGPRHLLTASARHLQAAAQRVPPRSGGATDREVRSKHAKHATRARVSSKSQNVDSPLRGAPMTEMDRSHHLADVSGESGLTRFARLGYVARAGLVAFGAAVPTWLLVQCQKGRADPR